MSIDFDVLECGPEITECEHGHTFDETCEECAVEFAFLDEFYAKHCHSCYEENENCECRLNRVGHNDVSRFCRQVLRERGETVDVRWDAVVYDFAAGWNAPHASPETIKTNFKDLLDKLS